MAMVMLTVCMHYKWKRHLYLGFERSMHDRQLCSGPVRPHMGGLKSLILPPNLGSFLGAGSRCYLLSDL